MARGRIRCRKCRTDYNPFGHTWLATVSMPYDKWLSLIKLFDLGISARRASKEAGVSYPVALKAFDTIRYSILHQLAKSDAVLRGEIEADKAYFGGKKGKPRTWIQKQDNSIWKYWKEAGGYLLA